MSQKYDITLKEKRTRASKRQNIFIQPKSVNHFHLQIYFIYSFVRLFVRSFAWRVCLFPSTAFIVFLLSVLWALAFHNKKLMNFSSFECWSHTKYSSYVYEGYHWIVSFYVHQIRWSQLFLLWFSFWLIMCRSTRSINVSPLYFFRCNQFYYAMPYSRKSMAKCV